MRMSLAVLVALLAASPRAAEQSWELRGEFVAIKSGDPEVLVLRFADGRTIEVPVASLSPAGQALARSQAAAATPAATNADDGAAAVVTVRGPFGRMIRVSVPESIKDVEADAIHCRSAAEAASVYRLFLADDRRTPAQRMAAEARLKEWTAMADKGLVRLGDRWVLQAEARAAADEATKVVDHALELMRLGNADLAEEELRKASHIDPESGRASFIMGLSYALVAKNPLKAIEHFTDTVHRSPNDPAALSNLAVLEVNLRRYATVVGHFRDAVAAATERLPIVENVAWAVKLAGDAKVNQALAKSRMPEKAIDDLNSLYQVITQELKLKPATNIMGPRFLGPDGVPCAAATVADIANSVELANAAAIEINPALGFIVAPGYVVCPREAVATLDGAVLGDVTIELPSARTPKCAATVVAAPGDGAVALLKCDGLGAEPLQLFAEMPPLPVIVAVGRSGESWLTGQVSVARGRVVTPMVDLPAANPFVHTAVLPRGPGGGPIVDHTGRVVGMVAATPRTDESGNTTGFGIPVERIWSLIKEHLPDVEAVADVTNGSDPAAAELRASVGTVIVSARRFRTPNGAWPPGTLR